MSKKYVGYESLNKTLTELNPGNSVIWHIDSLDDFRSFIEPIVFQAEKQGWRIVYLTFDNHEPLCGSDQTGVIYRKLNTNTGFVDFTKQIKDVFENEPKETVYFFDCLSQLDGEWVTDLMISNLLHIVCSDIKRMGSVALIPILRNQHSLTSIARMKRAVQIFLDLYHSPDGLIVNPVKISGRYGPTMFLPHLFTKKELVPITSGILSITITPDSTIKTIPKNRILRHIEKLTNLQPNSQQYQNYALQLCQNLFGDEERMMNLIRKHLTIDDFRQIGDRLVGDGAIGGRAAGLIVAKSILMQNSDLEYLRYLEWDDSLYVGSDIFCSYIIDNNLWDLYTRQLNPGEYFNLASELRERLLTGEFSESIREQFRQIIEHFEQKPIIVRSSSILEDSFRGAFAGKYESIFLANQGDFEQQLSQFEHAVRRVYSSMMNEDALIYRKQRGMDQQEEQMALVVQSVSGSRHEHYYFPEIAGVGTSRNIFAWAPHLDSKAGMLRLVVGLGTRAVDRTDDDYPRIVALDDPLLKPHAGPDETVRFSQHDIDVLNIEDNCLDTLDLVHFINQGFNVHIDILATREYHTERRMKELGYKDGKAWVLTFDNLLSRTEFPEIMKKILKSLESRYECPIDVEFTVNFDQDSMLKICLVQCRPMQTRGTGVEISIPRNIDPERILFKSKGYNMGGNISRSIKRIIYVEPSAYQALSLTKQYETAKLVGHLNRLVSDKDKMPTMLLGPGRWGTTTPSMGVPVSFAEISNATVLVEIAYTGGNLMPELSFGTHFFNDLVENDVFYAALFPQKEGVIFNQKLLSQMPDELPNMLPNSNSNTDCIRLFDTEKMKLQIMCDVTSQEVLCFINNNR